MSLNTKLKKYFHFIRFYWNSSLPGTHKRWHLLQRCVWVRAGGRDFGEGGSAVLTHCKERLTFTQFDYYRNQ